MASVFDELPAPTANIANYGALLFTKLEEASLVPYREVVEGDWKPEMKKCHHNAGIWTDLHPSHFQVLGWLVIDFRPSQNRIRFLAHSIIEDESGTRFDITPIASLEPRPFLPSYIDPSDFIEIEETLQQVFQVGGFDHFT